MTSDEYSAQYARLRERLAQTGWISEGYAQNRGPGAGGPCYQWTRKVKGKTVSVALSKEQFEWLQRAIEQWREVQATLKQLTRPAGCKRGITWKRAAVLGKIPPSVARRKFRPVRQWCGFPARSKAWFLWFLRCKSW